MSVESSPQMGRKAETVKQHNSEPAACTAGRRWSADDLHILWELLGTYPYTNVYHPICCKVFYVCGRLHQCHSGDVRFCAKFRCGQSRATLVLEHRTA